MKTIETHLKTNIKDFVVSRETYISSILVLDQFTRNVFRNSAKAYQGDEKAKQLCKIAIEKRFFQENEYYKNSFMLMPLMHSESLDDQEFSLPYFKKYTNPKTYEYALKHKDVIKKFGRFPHRNKILNRNSTQSELEFLNLPGSRF